MLNPHVALCRSLNHLLQHERWATDKLAAFAGQTLAVTPLPALIQPLFGPQLTLGIDARGHFQPETADHPASVTLHLADDFVQKMLVDRQNLYAHIKITGQIDLAETLGFVLRHLRWDVEADLAPWLGDILAHRLTRSGKELLTWQADARQRLSANLLEYLTEGQPLLVLRSDFNAQQTALRHLRDDLDRLEKRVQRLDQ